VGALPTQDRVAFSVWAPYARRVDLRLRGADHPLAEAGDGVWAAELDARPGDDYLVVLDGADAWPDPWSRSQPEGIRGPSRVVDTSAFRWTDSGWAGLRLEELVLYELHVGTFTPEGTFDAVVPRLRGLRELGVTAIELMPVAEFPGERGWGYDGVHVFAPHHAYGGPEGLARLVDAAHAEGLGIVLDAVYNHIGAGSERIAAFGPYFTDRHETFWGDAMNYDGPGSEGVREWAIQNALMWVREFHVDGLRLDATHAIFDDSPRHVLAELADRVREASPQALVISEMETGNMRPIEEWGHDAQWADELHHEQHVLITGEREGYYERYRGSVADLARQLERTPPERLVICVQNHDQVGNRAVGDRPPPGAARLQAALLLFAPQTPLLFMGQEYGEQRPFQFFTDHIDPAIAEATREGRKREFARFAAFSGDDVPDPQAPETFRRSKLDPSAGDEELRAWYAELLRLRRELPREVETEADEERRILRVRRGDVELVLDFARLAAELVRT
jgi:maltooligosyltrehalose trehalohydrolase